MGTKFLYITPIWDCLQSISSDSMPIRAIEHVTSLNFGNKISSAFIRIKLNWQGPLSTWGSQRNYVKPFSVFALEGLSEYPSWSVTKLQSFKSNTKLLKDHVKMISPSTFKWWKYYYYLRIFNENCVCIYNFPHTPTTRFADHTQFDWQWKGQILIKFERVERYDIVLWSCNPYRNAHSFYLLCFSLVYRILTPRYVIIIRVTNCIVQQTRPVI